MISGIGADIEDVKSFRKNYRDAGFINLLFTGREKAYCMKQKDPYIHFAGKFCAKEAVIKACRKKVPIRDIEVINSASGKVSIYIRGSVQPNIHCSISHTRTTAMAFVVAEK